MRSRVFLVGFSGLGVAFGSVCRPRTTGSFLSTSETYTTPVTSELILPSSTFFDTISSSTAIIGSLETLSESTSTDFGTSAALTTSTGVLSATSTETTTSFEETSFPTTEATTLETSVAVTTSADISTTTSELPSYPTLFGLSASTGPVADRTLQIEPINSKAPYFIQPASGHPSTPLSWDSATGHLIVSDTLSICVVYSRNRPTAQLRVCISGDVAADYLVCDVPTGTALQCKVPACALVATPSPRDPSVLVGVKTCYDDQEPWTQFYTRKETLLSSWRADIGPGGISDPDLTPIDLQIAEV